MPIFVAGFLFLSPGGSDGILSTIAVIATASRFAHAAGMFRIANVNERHPLRHYGALGTYICLFAVAIAVLLRAS